MNQKCLFVFFSCLLFYFEDTDILNLPEPPINFLDWPLLNRPGIVKKFHWQKMAAQLRLDADTSVFIDVRNEIDFKNKSRNTIYVSNWLIFYHFINWTELILQISPDVSIETYVDEQETKTLLRGFALSHDPIAMMFSDFVMVDITDLIEFQKELAKVSVSIIFPVVKLTSSYPTDRIESNWNCWCWWFTTTFWEMDTRSISKGNEWFKVGIFGFQGAP